MKSPNENSPPGKIEWIWRRIGSWRWQVNSDFLREPLLSRLDTPEILMAPPARLLRRRPDAPITEVVALTLPDLTKTPLILKRYKPRNAWQSCKDIFRPTRAQRAFELAVFLQARGVETAVPVAAAGTRAPWRQTSFLLTLEVPSATSLHELNLVCRDSGQRRSIIKAFGKVIASIHDLGFIHSDPSLTNFLVSRNSIGAFRLVMIDLDGLRPVWMFRKSWLLKNLKQLSGRARVSPREQLLFLAAYCRARNGLSFRETVHELERISLARHSVGAAGKSSE